uniref:Protein S100-A10 n=1 Tax=Propithecus coquereli TaxID=379532 RepID=A0A2K6FKP6_PROCO
SRVERATETMMFTFHRFARDKGYLTKEDLRVLMEKEFPGFLENQKDPLAFDKITKDLDQCLTITRNDYFVAHTKQKEEKQAELSNYST